MTQQKTSRGRENFGFRLLIGTVGWDRPDWTGSFYPEKLPDDWRLSYYATQFRVVLVPAADWRQADESTLAAWNEDGDPEFRFVIECDDGPADRDRLGQLAPRVLGVVLVESSRAVEPFLADYPQPAAIWDMDREVTPPAKVGLLVVRSSLGGPREQRQMLERLVSLETGGVEVALFFDTPAKALQATELAGLMGV